MALIKCKDCGNDISDSAAACPRCGAPVPRRPDPNQISCPHCSTHFSRFASVCPGCNAVKGYWRNQFGILGVPGTVFCGIVWPLVITVFVYQVFPPLGGWMALLMAIPVILSIYRLATGPYWFHRR
jgi:RNA polymerase subunit RPABC4/transcription elongation factor Spt4